MHVAYQRSEIASVSQVKKVLPGLPFFVVMALILSTQVNAESNTPTASFTAGNARFSLAFGSATVLNHTYSVFGIGGGYFVADNVEVGLDVEAWSGNSPRVEQVSPQARFVLTRDGIVQPYAGAFYRRTMIEGYPDRNTIGARTGMFFLTGRNAYFGAGLAQELHLSCDRNVYSSCSETYPELLFAVIF